MRRTRWRCLAAVPVMLLLAGAHAAAGKAYPMLGFAIVHLLPLSHPVDAADAIQHVAGVTDVHLMLRGAIHVPN